MALAFAVIVTAVWATAAVRSAGHGFDVTDEGFYLLSYRWWNVDHRTFTGVQYVYGPIFQLLGYDIAGLRLVRLGTILVVHAAFGASVMCWLRTRRPDAPPTRLWEAAGIAAITAAGGAAYGWLPLTPGYNDVVLLGSLAGMALILRLATHTSRDGRAPIRPAAGLGALVVPVLLVKWAALPVVALLVAGAAVAVAPAGVRGLVRAAAWMLGGVAAAVAVVQVALVPLTTALPGLVAVNALLAEQSMSLPRLLAHYWASSAESFVSLFRGYWPLLVAGAVAAGARGRRARWLAWPAAVAGLGMAIAHAARDGLAGGAVNVRHYLVPFLAVPALLLVTALSTAATRHRPASPPVMAPEVPPEAASGAARLREAVLLVLVATLPVAHALGTGNAPLLLAVNGFAAWMAVLIAMLTGLDRAATVARALLGAVAAISLVATASVALGGLIRHPYRTAGAADTTTTAAGVPALASVRLDPAAARRYADLRGELKPYLTPGHPMMAFDTMAGIVFLLDGRSVGEPWYPGNDPARVAAGIGSACPGGRVPGGQAPILLFNRPIEPADRAAVARCGLDLDRDYRPLDLPAGTAGPTVLVNR
jgi:hypothetical protein